MQVIKTLIVAAAVAGVSAQDTVIKSQTDQANSLTKEQIEAGLEMMPVTTNAQSQTCSTLPFREASKMMYKHDYEDDKALRGHFVDPLDLFYPNIKWEPVHHSLWTFDDKDKLATNPLGFRQAAFKDNTPICLHMSATTARHKLELMVDFMANSKICVEDIRTAHMNPSVELIRSCDSKGKINRCFSALDGKYASSRDPEVEPNVETNPTATNYAEQPADFAVAIGCFDGGCRDDYSTSRLYYRVRQSLKSWTDNQGGAGEGLDYWCMSLAALNPNYGIFRSSFSEAEINQVPQMYPSDMWTSYTRSKKGDKDYSDTRDYGTQGSGSSSTVTAGIATVALAVLSLMF
jgi:hypothetical protein